MTTLTETATKLLKAHGTADKALKPFVQVLKKQDNMLHELALSYLQTIKPAAKPTAAKPTQEDGSVNVKTFNVPGYRRRTHEEKQIALRARAGMADAVYEARFVRGKPIGDLVWGELRSLVDGESIHAASYLLEGKEATARAILLTKIAAFATVDDMKRKVRDVVPPNKMSEMIEQADTEAPVFIENFMHRYADSIKKGEIEQHE